MEGSPTRGQEKTPTLRLNEAPDLQTFQDELVSLVGADLKSVQVMYGFPDVDSQIWSLPSWARAYLERHLAVRKKLERGETVRIGIGKDNPGPIPAEAARSIMVLIPLPAASGLGGVILLLWSRGGSEPSAEDIGRVRRLALEAAPVLARLQELQRLRRENLRLAGMAAEAAEMKQRHAALLEEKTARDAVVQIWSHLQVNVAHELRTPLAAIRGYARMILDGRAGEVNDTQRQYLRTVSENTNRLINTVGWMSYVAELSARQFKPSIFDLRDVWAQCEAASRDLVRGKALTLTEQIPREDFVIIGDREKLAYAIDELLATAVKFSEAGQTIAAEFSHGREREVIVKISVKDVSVPADVLDRVFDRPFDAVRQMASGVDAGANLSGTYDYVGMHGGRVFVVSTAGQGATLMFTLPAVISGGDQQSHEQAIHSRSRRR